MWWALRLCWLALMFACHATETRAEPKFLPLEVGEPPVNGSDPHEDPAALRRDFGFGDRSSKKIVEHGGAISLEHDAAALVTPHIGWAHNYRGRPLRILWVVDPKYDLRAPMEIRQRSNFDITLLMIPAVLDMLPADEALQREFADRYDEILAQDYDVIVLRRWRTGHPVIGAVYDRLDQKVRQGCGLVCQLADYFWYKAAEAERQAYARMAPLRYGDGGMHAISATPKRSDVASPVSDGISFASWPPCSLTRSYAGNDAHVLATAGGRPIVATGRFGKGRTVAFHFETALLGNVGLVPEFDSEKHSRFGDYYEPVYALWLRALTWAAGREPPVRLQSPDSTRCVAGMVPEVNISAERLDSQSPAPLRLGYHLTDAYGDRMATGEMPLNLDGDAVSVVPDLPPLHADGLYRLDYWVDAEGRRYNWGTAAIEVLGGAAAISVDRVTRQPQPGEPIEFRVRSDRPGVLRVLAVDGNDRVFFDRTLKVDDEVTVSVDTRLSCLPANRIFFTLRARDSSAVLARQATMLYLPRIGLDSLKGQFLIAAYGRTNAAAHLRRFTGLLYRAAGINGVYFNNHARRRLQAAADEGLYSVGGKSWQFPQRGFAKIHKWTPNDPANRAKLEQQVARDAQDFQAYGAIGRVLDDESWFAFTGNQDGVYSGAQLSQDRWSIELFRKAMRKKYGRIEALNEIWDTDYTSFDQVQVVEEHHIAGKDNPSGWLEFREYMNWTYAARYYGWISQRHEAALGADFHAGCGAPHWTTEAGGSTYRGGDMARMRRHLSFMMLYGGTSPAGVFAGQPGGQKYDPPQNWRDYGAWKHLLTGADALWYYFGNAMVGSELAWRRHAVWTRDAVGEIERGCGALVSGADPAPSPVKILSTSPNQHMGWLYAKRNDGWKALSLAGGQPRSYHTFKTWMENLFVTAEEVTEAEIATGGLARGTLLLLPQQTNLSDAAIGAIREHVRGGGAVVADILPATRHRMGKSRQSSALADVFGVDSTETLLHTSSKAQPLEVMSAAGAPALLAPVPDSTAVTFAGIEATTADAHARVIGGEAEGMETPACLINKFGKGRAMLLNFVCPPVTEKTFHAHRRFAESLIRWAGIAHPGERIVDPATRQPLPYRPLYRFSRGQARLLGSIRGNFEGGNNPRLWDLGKSLSAGDDALFTWRGDRHAYNVRTGEYMGFGQSAEVELPPYEGCLLCLLPYRVDEVRLDVAKQAVTGQLLAVDARIEVAQGVPGDHLVSFDVFSPSGARRPLYCGVCDAPSGGAVFEIPFALNDPPGTWLILARDVMSGRQTSVEIVMSEPPSKERSPPP